MPRILVVGGTGLFGQHVCQEALRRGYDAVATHHADRPQGDARIGWERLDVTDPSAVQAVVRGAAPDLVVNAAAMTDVDGCEQDRERAKRVNETAAGSLASASHEVGAAFVHASTDYVFDGRGPAEEDTTPHPLNAYGHTKLAGEATVRQAHAGALVLRFSAVYGWNRVSRKPNAVTWILEKFEAGHEVPLFRDQKVTPTYAKTAAEVALDLVSHRASGLFHVACPECTSRVEMGRAIADVFQISNPRIKAVSMGSVAVQAKRPLAPCLIVRKVEETLKRSMPTFRACLQDMKATR